jgi:hypothetical protein
MWQSPTDALVSKGCRPLAEWEVTMKEKREKPEKTEKRHSTDPEEQFEEAHSGGPSRTASPREAPKEKKKPRG